MERLKVNEDRPFREINNDVPDYTEILADDLAEIGRMARGEFNVPTWAPGNARHAKSVIQGMFNTLNRVAELNNIEIDISATEIEEPAAFMFKATTSSDACIITVLAGSETEAKERIREQLGRNPSRTAYLEAWINGGCRTIRM